MAMIAQLCPPRARLERAAGREEGVVSLSSSSSPNKTSRSIKLYGDWEWEVRRGEEIRGFPPQSVRSSAALIEYFLP